jgi:RNA polymerase sigma-70 factor (ECF subfamily)
MAPNLRPSEGLNREQNGSAALGQLARRAIEGDRVALEELLRALGPEVVRTARLVVGAGAWAAEDAAQEALIDVMRGIGSLREPEYVRAWALRVAATRALKVARRERLGSLGRSLTDAPEPAGQLPDERLSEIKRAFDVLPPRMRAVAVLRLYAGLTEQETARALECSTGTVKSQLHEARRRLSEALRIEEAVPVTMPPMASG